MYSIENAQHMKFQRAIYVHAFICKPSADRDWTQYAIPRTILVCGYIWKSNKACSLVGNPVHLFEIYAKVVKIGNPWFVIIESVKEREKAKSGKEWERERERRRAVEGEKER